MRKHAAGKVSSHKNFARLEFIRSINPEVAEKLKGMLKQIRKERNNE